MYIGRLLCMPLVEIELSKMHGKEWTLGEMQDKWQMSIMHAIHLVKTRGPKPAKPSILILSLSAKLEELGKNALNQIIIS